MPFSSFHVSAVWHRNATFLVWPFTCVCTNKIVMAVLSEVFVCTFGYCRNVCYTSRNNTLRYYVCFKAGLVKRYNTLTNLCHLSLSESWLPQQWLRAHLDIDWLKLISRRGDRRIKGEITLTNLFAVHIMIWTASAGQYQIFGPMASIPQDRECHVIGFKPIESKSFYWYAIIYNYGLL